MVQLQNQDLVLFSGSGWQTRSFDGSHKQAAEGGIHQTIPGPAKDVGVPTYH